MDNLPYFEGYQYSSVPQSGSGLFGSIFRAVVPILKNVGRSALRHGLHAIADRATDVINNKSGLKQAALNAARDTVTGTVGDFASTVKPSRKRKNAARSKRKAVY